MRCISHTPRKLRFRGSRWRGWRCQYVEGQRHHCDWGKLAYPPHGEACTGRVRTTVDADKMGYDSRMRAVRTRDQFLDRFSKRLHPGELHRWTDGQSRVVARKRTTYRQRAFRYYRVRSALVHADMEAILHGKSCQGDSPTNGTLLFDHVSVSQLREAYCRCRD